MSSFYADAEGRPGWDILKAVVCATAEEARDVASLLRQGTRGTGVEVRTKHGIIPAHNALVEVHLVIKRKKKGKSTPLPELDSFFQP